MGRRGRGRGGFLLALQALPLPRVSGSDHKGQDRHMTNREKRTVAGPLMEVSIYPVWDDGRRLPERAPKTKPSTEAQRKYNEEQARRKLILRVNANFTTADYWMSPTFHQKFAPQDPAEAKRCLTNYIRRVRAAREKALKECKAQLKAAKAALKVMDQRNGAEAPCYGKRNRAAGQDKASEYIKDEIKRLKKKIRQLKKPLKYYYCIEKQIYKTGKDAGKVNWHFHMFISGGLDSAVMEELWDKGIKVNCRHFNPERFGPEAAARYMGKESADGRRRFGCSKNLVKPDEKIRDGRYTRRQVEKIATKRVDDRAWWERQYPGYRLLKTNCRWNEYNANWYVTAVMYKTDDDPPAWGYSAA